MPSLCSSATDREARRIALDEEGRELLPFRLRENNEEIGEAAVGDPHLLAVEHVVPAIFGEHGAGAAIQGVRTRRGLRECVSSNPLARRQFRKVFLLLCLRAIPHDGECADADVGAECRREARQLADRLRDDGGSDLVHPHSAVHLGDVHAHQSEFAGFAEKPLGNGEILGLDFTNRRHDFVPGKLGRRFRNLALFFREVLRSEDIPRFTLLDEKTAALGPFRRTCV